MTREFSEVMNIYLFNRNEILCAYVDCKLRWCRFSHFLPRMLRDMIARNSPPRFPVWAQLKPPDALRTYMLLESYYLLLKGQY
jgi:hypothetical protein